MGNLIFVVGKSGSGKSTSLRNLNPDETVICNTDQKALPFKQFSLKYNEEKGNYYKTSNTVQIVKVLKEAHNNPIIKSVIIDTWNRLQTDETMCQAFREEKGFVKYQKFAAQHYDLINIINEKVRDTLNVYLFCHPDVVVDDIGQASEKILTAGKSLDKFVPESFSSIVLYCEILKIHGENNRHVFRTKNSGANTGKSPIDMFDEDFIDNDLVIVNDAIREYYGI